jgi:hypothetical protein
MSKPVRNNGGGYRGERGERGERRSRSRGRER